jgi:hypothetical protein
MALPLSTLPFPGLPPELLALLFDTEVETAGGDSQSLGSTKLETWLGDLMTITEEGLSWPEGATKLNHWTTTPGVGVGEGPASIHLTGMSR